MGRVEGSCAVRAGHSMYYFNTHNQQREHMAGTRAERRSSAMTQEQLIYELNTQCDTNSKLFAAALITERFFAEKDRDPLIWALLRCYQDRQEASWSIALLQLLCGRWLQRAAARHPERSEAEIRSAFYRAVEEHTLHCPADVLLSLHRGFLRALREEACPAEESALELSHGEVRSVLGGWVGRGLLPFESARYVLTQLFPTSARSSVEREQCLRRALYVLKRIFHDKGEVTTCQR